MWRIVNSPFGLHLKALRDNAQKAEYVGVRVRQFRLAAFVISAVYGAIGGAILGFRVGVADPELVHWTHSGHLVFMTVLGGFSSFFGPITGALALTLLQDQLQSITQYWRFVLGAILAAMVIFFPRGLAGIAGDLAGAASARRKRRGRSMTPLVETKGVSKHYGAFRALDDVTRVGQPKASSCRSSAPTAPARPRWSIC